MPYLELIQIFKIYLNFILSTNKSIFFPCLDRMCVESLFLENINDITLSVISEVINLGVIFDNNCFKPHINKFIKKLFIDLKLLYVSRHALIKKLNIVLCNTLVLSNFKFCYVLYGSFIDKVDKNHIQCTQNSWLQLIFDIIREKSIYLYL